MMLTRTFLTAAVCAILTAVGAAGPSLAGAVVKHHHGVKHHHAGMHYVPGKRYVARPAATPRPDATKGKVRSSPDERARRIRTGVHAAGAAVAPVLPAASGPTPNVLMNQIGLGPTSGVNPSDVGAAIGPGYFVQGVNATGIAVFRRSDLSLVTG